MDLETLYAILVGSARHQTQITYSELSEAYFKRTEDWHEPHGSWDDPLGELNHMLHGNGWPPLSAVVVLGETKQPGGGFWASCPNIPARPRDELARIATYGQILAGVHAAKWPERMPTGPRS